jgi:hypothetical protein
MRFAFVAGASGALTDPYCGLRTRLIRYGNQLEFNVVDVEAGKASLRALLQSDRCLQF